MSNNPHNEGTLSVPVAMIAIVLLLGAAVFGACWAPCSWYAGSRAKDVPARCMKEYLP